MITDGFDVFSVHELLRLLDDMPSITHEIIEADFLILYALKLRAIIRLFADRVGLLQSLQAGLFLPW